MRRDRYSQGLSAPRVVRLQDAVTAVNALDSRPANRPPAHRTQGFADGVRGGIIACQMETH
jgi:hypothetical protein